MGETPCVPGLSGANAIVWGAGAGMGLATARVLASSGCNVALVDVDAGLAESAADKLRSEERKAIGLRADVTEEADVVAAVDQAAAELGPITRSASVVGVSSWSAAIDMSVDQWHRDQTLNLLPMFLIGRTMARHIRDRSERGSLAFVASISGLQAAHSHSSYGAAKSAMGGLVQSFAGEWGPLGIRANLVAPGVIRTARIASSGAMDALLQRKLPSGRMGEVEEMANCLGFLLSDLSSYVTGQTLVADGGWMTVPAILPSDNPKLPEKSRN